MQHNLELPLGVTHIQHGHPELAKVREIFGGFVRMTFTITRSSLDAYQVHIHHHEVSGARDTSFSYDEVIGGLIGDTHQLGYERTVTFKQGAHGRLVLIIKNKN